LDLLEAACGLGGAGIVVGVVQLHEPTVGGTKLLL
jgi:hypothetical protein